MNKTFSFKSSIWGLFLLLAHLSCWSQNSDFNIYIERYKVEKGLIYGKISVNNKIIGNTYENEELVISQGSYSGKIRYCSKKGFVQRPLGKLGNTGDFLLELGGTEPRTDILFHAGNKPIHSDGCILLGPVNTSMDGSKYVDENHPLHILRVLFYGTETPNACPDKKINIEIIDNY